MRARLQKSESVKWTSHDGVMVCKWHDKVVLGMTLCDQHDATDKSSICRCPSALWTTTATWVAWIDQMRAYYSVGRAGCCWGKYIFWGLLNVGLINSLILWTIANRPLPASARLFGLKTLKLAIIHNMCDDHVYRTQRMQPAVDNLVVDHVVAGNVIEGHPLVKFADRKRTCYVCARDNVKPSADRHVESSFGCSTCRVYLCKAGVCS